MRRAVLIAVALIAACAPPGSRAPLVDGPVADAAQRAGALDAARRGREIYTTTCTDCHSAPDPNSVSQARLDKLLPRMFRSAALDAAERADVRAYLTAARAAHRSPRSRRPSFGPAPASPSQSSAPAPARRKCARASKPQKPRIVRAK